MNLPRKFLAPEVIQTSAMDCGPATLKCLLAGFRRSVSYGRLREACQTDLDGTSIDTIEEVANAMGLEAEQVLIPRELLFGPGRDDLPGVAVTQLPNGVTHFVIVWRRVGSRFQVMDPMTGRLWMRRAELLDQLYEHSMQVPESDWFEWASSDEFLKPLRRRMRRLGVSRSAANLWLGEVPSARELASLDAAVRMAERLHERGGLSRGRSAAAVIERLRTAAQQEWDGGEARLPSHAWAASRVPESGEVTIRGALLVRVAPGARTAPVEQLQPELAAALEAQGERPFLEVGRLLLRDGWFAPVAIVVMLALAAAGVIVEAVLLRSLVDLARELTLSGQRMGAMALLAAFATGIILLEYPAAILALRGGRGVESRFRAFYLHKLPRLTDRYFQSRLSADMAERSHVIHYLRRLPELGAQFLRTLFEMAFIVAAIGWLDIRSLPLAIAAAGGTLAIALGSQKTLIERDSRVRSHAGALARFYLDALVGVAPVRAHSAEVAVRREQRGLLARWRAAAYAMQRSVVAVETLQFLLGFGLAAWLVYSHVVRGGEGSHLLLMGYWALSLPVLGQEIALLARQYPHQRNRAARLIEPLNAPISPESAPQPAARSGDSPRGTAVALSNVTVVAAGQRILHDVSLDVGSGEHVAIVGASGAGKSTLVGLLLGWYRIAGGEFSVDGQAFDAGVLRRLRRRAVWIDPAAQLWNRSLLDNVNYGRRNGEQTPLSDVLDAAELRPVVEILPDGLQTPLGENGGVLSGGEGQRVRAGRGAAHPTPSLVLMDEPFRGLDRAQRHRLLNNIRQRWPGATLLCVTHDIAATVDFDKVVVVAEGSIREQGIPAQLAQDPASAYASMLHREEQVLSELWGASIWRRLRIRDGDVQQATAAGGDA